MQDEISPLRGAVVLVVEDNPDVLEATGYLIEAAFGCTVLTASSCVEALALIDAGQRPDLLFSDAGLPGKDGLTLARLARERLPHLPIALVTGWADEIDSINDRGFIALLKPYSVEQVQGVFSDLLSSRITNTRGYQRTTPMVSAVRRAIYDDRRDVCRESRK